MSTSGSLSLLKSSHTGRRPPRFGDVEPGANRAIDQALMLVDEELAEIAGAGADRQVLVAVIVEIGPARAMGVRSQVVDPDLGVATSRKVPLPLLRNRLSLLR